MITFPNAKINLGLNVLNKRPDGYHEISSCLYPVFDLCDALEMVPAERFSFSCTGLPISGSTDSNLIVKAYRLLQEKYTFGDVAIHLHKVIPMGAGLGGGSADGAFALKMLNGLFNLQLSTDVLKNLASELGSDCPFFIDNVPALVSGTGTSLEAFDLDLENYEIKLLHPEVHVSTKEAYSMVTPGPVKTDIREVLSYPVQDWQGHLINDFEGPVSEKFPEIRKAKEELLKQGAQYAAMTGSGSSVFGIFSK